MIKKNNDEERRFYLFNQINQKKSFLNNNLKKDLQLYRDEYKQLEELEKLGELNIKDKERKKFLARNINNNCHILSDLTDIKYSLPSYSKIVNEIKSDEDELNELNKVFHYRNLKDQHNEKNKEIQNYRQFFDSIINEENENDKEKYKKEIQDFDSLAHEEYKIREKLDELFIPVPPGNQYEIIGGLPEMKRDINIKLSRFLEPEKTRELFGVDSEYYKWKDHFLFKKINYTKNIPIFVYGYDIKEFSSNIYFYLPKWNNYDYEYQGLGVEREMEGESGIYSISFIPLNCVEKIYFYISENRLENKKYAYDVICFYDDNLYKDNDNIKIEFNTYNKIRTLYLNGKVIEQRELDIKDFKKPFWDWEKKYPKRVSFFFDLRPGAKIKFISFEHKVIVKNK
jgi:hypothetical protein